MAHYRLTELQAAFCHELIKGKSAAEAARDAGYSASYADRQAKQLLENPRVSAYLDELRTEVKSESILSARELQEWWSKLVKGLEAEAKIQERLKASELLGKSQGVFVERQESSGDLTIRIRRE